ncbi:hypothetical protein ASJ30_00295 [Janibacter indicus]|uniref:Uncharacterized protein n=1 Tax=Janibacter indicus TaxID=857417 RepID=A0A1L3MCQ2_9MICO|nr:hypothetical protein [Janibacter indicus]APH00159.1 hypothetical protein ASJ30_00295 [Janibacter indicus]
MTATMASRAPRGPTINWAAVGIGATMTLAMDARLVSTKARVGFVFGRIGIVPEDLLPSARALADCWTKGGPRRGRSGPADAAARRCAGAPGRGAPRRVARDAAHERR